MEGALEDIQFLANSENRIRVLSALTRGSASRRQLQEETGVPRSSAARVLEEAETRGWVGSSGSEYWITPRGEAMVAEIRRSIATTEGVKHLGEAIEWLPEPSMISIFAISTTRGSRYRRKRIRLPRSIGGWIESATQAHTEA